MGIIFSGIREAAEDMPSVERREKTTPTGKHTTEVTLAFDTKEAAEATKTLLEMAQEIAALKDYAEAAARANFCGGYIRALVETETITPAQADELQNVVNKTVDMVIDNIFKEAKKKRGN